jgi:ribosomal protein S27E
MNLVLYAVAGLVIVAALTYLYLHTSFSIKCPKCGKIDEERISRSRLARFVSRFIPTKAYRCRKCWNEYVVIGH